MESSRVHSASRRIEQQDIDGDGSADTAAIVAALRASIWKMVAEDRYSSLPAPLEDQSGETIGAAADCSGPACLSRKAFNPPRLN
jgi:hypothetical protein